MDLPTALLLLLPLALLPPILLYLLLPPRPPKQTPTLVITHTPGNHSPRALAHAHQLLRHTPHPVLFLCLPPSPPPHPSLIPITLPPPPPSTTHRTSVSLLRKLLHHAYNLLTTLYQISTTHSPTHIILNTPPILPILPTILLVRPLLFPKSHLTIDWHNLAYSLMQVNKTPSHLVTLAKHLEHLLPRAAHNHWAVSNALSHHLQHHAALHPTVVYDRPRHHTTTQHTPSSRRHILHNTTACATVYGPVYNLHPSHLPNTLAHKMPPIVITSTSWTPDEEFDMLRDAIQHWDRRAKSIIVIITGKGPMRREFESAIQALQLRTVSVWFAWVAARDYAALIAAADVGVCLHASSSGLDLPMKVVDMLGCNVPVVARRFYCVEEIVRDGVCGLLFENSDGLIKGVERIVWGGEGVQFRTRIQRALHGLSWQREWEIHALPTLVGLQCRSKPS